MPCVNLRSPDELIHRLGELGPGALLLERLGKATPVHVVGGAVRDLLLDLKPGDLDLVVDGDAHALAKRLDPGALLHERFGTATFHVDGFAFDIARARRERYPHPGALPEVVPARLDEDLLRRDFTVNAIAMALGEPEPGAVAAAPHALADLEARRLRVLHRESFRDDPTRLLRLIRYAARLGFAIEDETAGLAADAVAAGALGTVSGARVGAELRLLAREPDPVAALAGLEQFGLASAVAPGFGLADRERAQRALEILGTEGRRDLLVLALAFQDAELPALLDRLAFDAVARRTIVSAAKAADGLARGLAAASTPSQIAEAVGDAPPELVASAGSLGPRRQAERWLRELRHVRLEIDGGDLLGAGVSEGPSIGRGLRGAWLAKLDGRVQGREEELAQALRAAADSG
jgi:tRNA nucleotidyltransferase (CCA-adding enzyme)